MDLQVASDRQLPDLTLPYFGAFWGELAFSAFSLDHTWYRPARDPRHPQSRDPSPTPYFTIHIKHMHLSRTPPKPQMSKQTPHPNQILFRLGTYRVAFGLTPLLASDRPTGPTSRDNGYHLPTYVLTELARYRFGHSCGGGRSSFFSAFSLDHARTWYRPARDTRHPHHTSPYTKTHAALAHPPKPPNVKRNTDTNQRAKRVTHRPAPGPAHGYRISECSSVLGPYPDSCT